jgi:hypothetical protein
VALLALAYLGGKKPLKTIIFDVIGEFSGIFAAF